MADEVVTSPVIADTDLVIDFLRGKGDGVEAIRLWLTEGRLRLTAITAFELRVGADHIRRGDDIARLLAGRVLPLDARAALEAGAIETDLRRNGERIGFADTLQAGIARRFKVPLATRNVRHFRRVTGLVLEPMDQLR